jgi:transcriptional regulator
MYLPPHFREERADVLRQLIRGYPLGTLVTLAADGLRADHIPSLLEEDPAPLGTLRGHVARANPVWREFDGRVQALVVFQGPQAYVSPSWYPTKRETGRVVPTYNYVVVHAYGVLRAVDDSKWLRGLVERLTSRFEEARTHPWQLDDAPADYVKGQLKGIVGVEIAVTRLIGKWKTSQNRPAADRAGVACGLREAGDANSAAMAAQV